MWLQRISLIFQRLSNMNKPVIKSTTDVAVMLHKKGLEVNKWNHIAIRFGLRDTFRVYVNEPMKGNITIELVRVCGLYEQQHEKQIGTYSTLTTDEKRLLVSLLERGKYEMVDDESEQFIYRLRNFCFIHEAPLVMRIYNSRINEDDTRYIQDRW